MFKTDPNPYRIFEFLNLDHTRCRNSVVQIYISHF